MRIVPVDERLAVAPQPDVAELGDLAAQGFRALINARPDGEDPGQPGSAAEKAACAAAGLAYHFIPVAEAAVTQADVQAFGQALTKADGRVLAHCRTGQRALMLHALGQALEGRMAAPEIAGFGTAHGFDLTGAVRWLERERACVPQVTGFFDGRTASVQYIVTDPATKHCAIIDPVYDFDEKSGATATRNADALLAHVERERLTVEWILDTHPHADHFSAAHYLKTRTGAPIAIGARVVEVQRLWQQLYHWPELRTDGAQWDRLFADGDRFRIGELEARVMSSPGHTLASVSYLIGDTAFIHDTVFMPDGGTARTDFPGGSAEALWDSIQAILALPDDTRLFTGHDYQPGGRHPRWQTTVAEQKRSNPHLANCDRAAFLKLRQARDRTLPMPKLILHALQVNLQGGRLPEPEADGRRYLKFPLDALPGAVW
ncbi:bifunctional sulfur transferase/dioxygenase Blh [Geminicoccus harenae]|uniref:bifunctional sulfur transferase/dioxygenase Blh n=1 Tax=Geminicoccus harenae TaxID=2498453 RepID=UPI00168B7514|nr:bifunctional sulfur transferase/dioxygenase Blh [Geminicoccus harenae]